MDVVNLSLSLYPRAIREMAVRGFTGKRLITRSIPDWRRYWYSACYSVLVSQAGCNGRVTSPPFFFFSVEGGTVSQTKIVPSIQSSCLPSLHCRALGARGRRAIRRPSLRFLRISLLCSLNLMLQNGRHYRCVLSAC